LGNEIRTPSKSRESGMLFNSMDRIEEQSASPRRTTKWWLLPLLLPYLGLLFPQVYARATPALFGFPFFYWYQFLWVILTSAILGVVYRKLKT
jgi:hypothetical protein